MTNEEKSGRRLDCPSPLPEAATGGDCWAGIMARTSYFLGNIFHQEKWESQFFGFPGWPHDSSICSLRYITSREREANVFNNKPPPTCLITSRERKANVLYFFPPPTSSDPTRVTTKYGPAPISISAKKKHDPI